MPNYLENLMKEAKQTAKAWKGATDASGDIKPGADARAFAANNAYDSQKRQLVLALVQGRRYDDNTGKQIKGKKK